MKRLLSRYLISTMCSLSFFLACGWGCLLVFCQHPPLVSFAAARAGSDSPNSPTSPPPPDSSGSQGGYPRVHQKLSYPSLNLFIYSLSHP